MKKTITFEQVVFDQGEIIKRTNQLFVTDNEDYHFKRLIKQVNECYSLNYELDDVGEDYVKLVERYTGHVIELEPVL